MNLRFCGVAACACVLLGIIGSAASAAAEEEIPSWAILPSSQFYEAYNSRNPEGFNAYYAESVQVNQNKGRKAVVDALQKEWEELDDICTRTLTHFKVVGDFATGFGEDVCIPKGSDANDASRLNWISTYQRQPDGGWRVIIEAWEESN